jgi:hypothetical protein
MRNLALTLLFVAAGLFAQASTGLNPEDVKKAPEFQKALSNLKVENSINPFAVPTPVQQEEASCTVTVEVSIGFLGIGGKVTCSATADTCQEARSMVSDCGKKKKAVQ